MDAARAAALLDSDKDLEEHEYAVHSVAEALAAHCTDLDVPTPLRTCSRWPTSSTWPPT